MSGEDVRVGPVEFQLQADFGGDGKWEGLAG